MSLKFYQGIGEAFLLGRMILARIGACLLDGRPLSSIRADLLTCTGRFRFRSQRSIWIYGETPEAFLAADAVIASMRRIASESCLVMTTDAPQTEAWLRARFPDDRAFPAPWPKKEFTKRFIQQIAPQMIVILQSTKGFNPIALRLAQAQGIPIVQIDVCTSTTSGKMAGAVSSMRMHFSHFCVQEAGAAVRLREAGVPPEQITMTGRLAFESALLAPPGNPDYLRQEIGVRSETRFILAEKIAMAEEGDFLKAFAALRARHRNLVFLWKPTSAFQLWRFKARLEASDLAARRWNEHSTSDPAVIILDPAAAAAPFYGICTAVIAGGTFSRLRLPGCCAEPLTIHAPIVVGPFVPESATVALQLIHSSAALQCPVEDLATTLSQLMEGDAAAVLLCRVRQLMEPSRGASKKTVRAISPLYSALQDEHPAGIGWRPKKTRAQREAMKNPTAAIEKIELEDWAAFQVKLGACCSILCLGNGPTSESPAAIATPHDCLFRANWRWKDRGILTHPNAVFVGDPATIGKLDLPSTFIFPDPEREFSALRSRRILDRKAPVEYFTLTRSSCDWLVKVAQDTYARPSNGALMIATAVALQPECLTIAGLDLFNHDDGRYPGDLQGTNAYSQSHDPEYELVVIERALKEYRGRLVILSSILVDALNRRRFFTNSRPFHEREILCMPF